MTGLFEPDRIAGLFEAGRTITLKAQYALLAIPAVLLLSVIIWVVAFERGKATENTRLKNNFDIIDPASPSGADSGAGDIPLNPGLLDQPAPLPAKADSGTGATRPGPEKGRPASNTPRQKEAAPSRPPAPSVAVTPPPAGSDPRVPGNNYLVLGTLSRDHAEAAVGFLAQNGVRAIAVPLDAVDPNGGAGNNPGRYQVFSVQEHLTPEQYKSDHPLMDGHKREIARLGAMWKRDRGPTDFPGAFWKKYKP